jgi:hypothetical protein
MKRQTDTKHLYAEYSHVQVQEVNTPYTFISELSTANNIPEY